MISIFLRVDKEIFVSCPAESLDYTVMEKTSHAVAVPMEVGWSDIGSWSPIWDISPKNNEGNVTSGDVILQNTKN